MEFQRLKIDLEVLRTENCQNQLILDELNLNKLKVDELNGLIETLSGIANGTQGPKSNGVTQGNCAMAEFSNFESFGNRATDATAEDQPVGVLAIYDRIVELQDEVNSLQKQIDEKIIPVDGGANCQMVDYSGNDEFLEQTLASIQERVGRFHTEIFERFTEAENYLNDVQRNSDNELLALREEMDGNLMDWDKERERMAKETERLRNESGELKEEVFILDDLLQKNSVINFKVKSIESP